MKLWQELQNVIIVAANFPKSFFIQGTIKANQQNKRIKNEIKLPSDDID